MYCWQRVERRQTFQQPPIRSVQSFIRVRYRCILNVSPEMVCIWVSIHMHSGKSFTGNIFGILGRQAWKMLLYVLLESSELHLFHFLLNDRSCYRITQIKKHFAGHRQSCFLRFCSSHNFPRQCLVVIN